MSASQQADSLPPKQPSCWFLSLDVSKDSPIFFSFHMVNLVGTGNAIHLMNALIKVSNIHIITGQFSSCPFIKLYGTTALSRVSIKFLNFVHCYLQEIVSTEFQMAKMMRKGWPKSHCVPNCTNWIKDSILSGLKIQPNQAKWAHADKKLILTRKITGGWAELHLHWNSYLFLWRKKNNYHSRSKPCVIHLPFFGRKSQPGAILCRIQSQSTSKVALFNSLLWSV